MLTREQSIKEIDNLSIFEKLSAATYQLKNSSFILCLTLRSGWFWIDERENKLINKKYSWYDSAFCNAETLWHSSFETVLESCESYNQDDIVFNIDVLKELQWLRE